MATATLSSVPTPIDNAEATTNWGGDTFALNTSDHIQGNSCVECVQTVNGNNDVYVTGTWDFSGTGSGDQHLRLWFLITYVGNLSATNPIQVFLYDGTNTAYYYWDKASSYTGGWAQVVIYTGDSPDSGSVTKSSITRIGIRMVTSTKPRNATWNALYDAWTYGDGYTVYGGSSGDPIDWSHIAATDLTSAYGVVREFEGVYYLRGDIQIGDGTNTTYFEPSGQVAVFAKEQVLSTLYTITFFDDASNVTNIDYTGGVIAAAEPATLRFDIDANLTDFNALSISGVQISGCDNATLPASSSFSITDCVWDNCNQILPQGCTFTGHTIKNSTDTGGALLWPEGTTVTQNCIFSANSKAVEHDTINSVAVGTCSSTGSGTQLLDTGATFTTTVAVNDYAYNETDNSYAKVTNVVSNTELTTEALTTGSDNTWQSSDAYSISPPETYTNNTFSSNTTDVNNTATGTDALFVNKSGTSNPTTSSGTVVFLASVGITITVKNVAGTVIQNAQTGVFLTSDGSQVLNTDTNASGVASGTFTGTTPAEAKVWIRKASSGSTKYKNYSSVQNITSSGLTLDVTLVEDPNNNATS